MADPLLVYGSNARKRSGQKQSSTGTEAGEEAGEELLTVRPEAEVAVGIEVAVAAGSDEGDLPVGRQAGGDVDGAVRVVVAGNQESGDRQGSRAEVGEGGEQVSGEGGRELVGRGDQESAADVG
jgi:hypothetical protein